MKNDGGPAFPHTREQVATGMHGMTLRDYFAAAAMTGIVAACGHDEDGNIDYVDAIVAKSAYALADAMLAAREVGR